MPSLKRKIVNILDKSTNNNMKAEDIVTIIGQAITQAQYDMWDMCKADRNRPSINSVDWVVAMIENRLFGRLDNGE